MPYVPVFYKDLNKRENDLLSKDFPSERRENKVDWRGETSSDVSFETTLTQRSDGSVLGTFSPKYNVREWNTTLAAELKTNRDFKAEVVINNHFTPGLRTTITGESRGEDLVGTVGVEYRREFAAMTASINYGAAAGSTLRTTTVVGNNGFQVGAEFDYSLEGTGNDSAIKFNTVASYSTEEFDIGFFGKILNGRDSNILGANFFQRVNPHLSVGAEVAFDTQNPDNKPKLTGAAQYIIDPTAVFKTKFDTTGRLGLSYAQRFNSSRLTVSGTVDTNNLTGKNASSVNFNLSLF